MTFISVFSWDFMKFYKYLAFCLEYDVLNSTRYFFDEVNKWTETARRNNFHLFWNSSHYDNRVKLKGNVININGL